MQIGLRARPIALAALACGGAVAWLLGAAGALAAPADASSVLRVTGMTFVGSRGSERELVLRSRVAVFRPDRKSAELEGVSAEVSQGDGGRSFSMTCERVEFDIESQDFLAEGAVEGATSDGQRYSAPWVRYDHDEGVLYTEAPVLMEDETGSFRGDGFRYHVAERRFQLLGNVRVEQAP